MERKDKLICRDSYSSELQLVYVEKAGQVSCAFEKDGMKLSFDCRLPGGIGDNCDVYFCCEPLVPFLLERVHAGHNDYDFFFISSSYSLASQEACLYDSLWILDPKIGLAFIKHRLLAKSPAVFYLDWCSLSDRMRTEYMNVMNANDGDVVIKVIDRAEFRSCWEGKTACDIECVNFRVGPNVYPSMLTFASTAMQGGNFTPAELERFWEFALESNVTDVPSLITLIDLMGGVEKARSAFIDDKSLLYYAARRCLPSECLAYLVEKGFRLRAHDKDFDYDAFYGLAINLYDTEDFVRVFSAIMDAGYEVDEENLYEIISGFISNAAHFDNILGFDYVATHDTSSRQCFHDLDECRCREFDAIIKYFPDSVFDHRDSEGETLLMRACRQLSSHRVLPRLFSRILEHTSDVNLCNEDGDAPLDLASDDEIVKLLRERGARHGLNCTEDIFEKINHWFFTRNEEDKIRIAGEIRHPALPFELDALDSDGLTAFSYAMSLYDFVPDLYSMLLESGFDLNQKGRDGENALFAAVRSPDSTREKLEWLFGHNADPSAVNDKGQTIFHLASSLFHIGDGEWSALGSATDSTLFIRKDNAGLSPLVVAFRFMNMPAIRYLMEHGHVAEEDLAVVRRLAGEIRSPRIRAELERLFEPYGGLGG